MIISNHDIKCGSVIPEKEKEIISINKFITQTYQWKTSKQKIIEWAISYPTQTLLLACLYTKCLSCLMICIAFSNVAKL